MASAFNLLTSGLASALKPLPVMKGSKGATLSVSHLDLAAVSSNLQLLVPAPVWDWAVDPIGSTSVACYEFCSWMPATAAPSVPYETSGYRFSESYESFLKALPNSNDAAVQSALARFNDDHNKSLVMYPSGGQLMPAWQVSGNPRGFVESIAGQPGLAQTIHIDMNTASDPGSRQIPLLSAINADAPKLGMPITFSAGEVTDVTIHADAWGRIAARPGKWYLTTTIRQWSGWLDRNNYELFFESDGMLCCLLTDLCVALNVTITMAVSPAVAHQVRADVAKGSTIRMGGLDFDAHRVSVSPAHQGTHTLGFSAAAAEMQPQVPVIVGVWVSSLG